MLAYCYWPLAVALMATGQGLLLPAIRRTPPGSEARRQTLALHYVLVASYYLPLTLWGAGSLLLGAALATGSRLLFFDLVLNLASGQRPFYVGNTAAADKAMQWLAGKTSWSAEHLRFAGWVVCLVVAAAYLIS